MAPRFDGTVSPLAGNEVFAYSDGRIHAERRNLADCYLFMIEPQFECLSIMPLDFLLAGLDLSTCDQHTVSRETTGNSGCVVFVEVLDICGHVPLDLLSYALIDLLSGCRPNRKTDRRNC
jgi:hypothetical protein